MSVSARRGGRFVRRLAHRLQGGPEGGGAIWDTIQLARHQDRPYTLDYIPRLFTEFEELRGDRYRESSSCAHRAGHAIAVGHKGRDTPSDTEHRIPAGGLPQACGFDWRTALQW